MILNKYNKNNKLKMLLTILNMMWKTLKTKNNLLKKTFLNKNNSKKIRKK